MNADQTERALLDEHELRWVAQGYQVIRQPRPNEVPDFLRNFRPDALVVGREPNLVVEIVRKGSPYAEEKIRRLKTLMAGRANWRLEILYSGAAESGVAPTTSEAISDLLGTARALNGTEPRAALLLTWAALEALARRLEPGSASRPQSPGRVAELLAGAGHISPSEAERLRAAADLRNRLIHGDLSVRPGNGEVRLIIETADKLLKMLIAD